jgi:hypothetical protein
MESFEQTQPGNSMESSKPPQADAAKMQELMQEAIERNAKVENAKTVEELADLVRSFETIAFSDTEDVSGEEVASRMLKWSPPHTIPATYGLYTKYTQLYKESVKN